MFTLHKSLRVASSFSLVGDGQTSPEPRSKRDDGRGNSSVRPSFAFEFVSLIVPTCSQGLANMKNSTLSQSNGDDMDISVRSSDVGSGPDDTGAAVPHSGPSRPGASTTSTLPRPSSDVPHPPLGDEKTQVSAVANHRPNKKAQKTSGRGSGRPTRAGARQPHEDDHSLFIAQANSIRGRASRTRSAARDLHPRAQTRTAECGTKDKQEGSSSKSKRSRTTANRPSRSQMAGRRQQLNWQWAQSLIGLQLNVPGCKFLKTLNTFAYFPLLANLRLIASNITLPQTGGRARLEIKVYTTHESRGSIVRTNTVDTLSFTARTAMIIR